MKTIFLGCSLFLLTAFGFSQTEIRPYMPSSELHGLVGTKAKVEGIYYGDIFEAPVVLIKGHTFYLLQNPPSKRTYRFPRTSRPATVTGTLYFYDHAQLNNAEYGAIGKEYFFFNVDEASVEFGEAQVAEGFKAFIKTWKFNAEYTRPRMGKIADVVDKTDFDKLSEEDQELADVVFGAFDKISIDLFMEGARLLITTDTIHEMMMDSESEPSPYTLKKFENGVAELVVDYPNGIKRMELEIVENGMLRYSKLGPKGKNRLNFYYE